MTTILNGTATYDALISAGNGTWLNYEVTGTCKIVTGSASNEVSLVVRMADSLNFYWMGLGCWGHEYSISKAVNGVCTELEYSGVIGDVDANVDYVLKAVCDGSTLELWVDGDKKLEATDTSLTSGRLGVRTYNATVQVSALSASVGSAGPGASASEAFFMLKRRK
jgi:hypothetical protein